MMDRVNAFLGYNAIGRVRIVQKPVATGSGKRKPTLRDLTAPEKAKLADTVKHIEDDGLRASLERLGATILGKKR